MSNSHHEKFVSEMYQKTIDNFEEKLQSNSPHKESS